MEIRKLEAFEEYEDCVELQRIVWDFSDRDLMPARYLKVTHLHGGSVLGAFDHGRLIAFAFAQPSVHDGRLALHSNILAVLPEYRNQGVGAVLKYEQRRDALARGIALITWTYDPLQARNAYLNLNKLGVVVHTYIPDLYGTATSSSLHSGLGTDRVVAEWWLQSPRVQALLGEIPAAAGGETRDEPVLPRSVLHLADSANGHHTLVAGEPTFDGSAISMEIPVQLMELMDADGELARQWRRNSRDLLTECFSRGYQITRLARVPAGGAQTTFRTHYILEACENRSH